MIASALQFLKRTLSKPEGKELKDLGPMSRSFGMDRGTPIDRYYIQKFINAGSKFIKGDVLEIGSRTYSGQFTDTITSSTVLHAVPGNNQATIVGDLSRSESLPGNKFDCFICTQTLNFIYDLKAAVQGCYKLLKPGGIIMVTVSGISQVSQYDMTRWGDYWRFTPLSARRLFEEYFDKNNIEVDYYGNCLAATSFLRGLCAEEVNAGLLEEKDIDYPLTITIIARKN